ncbi:hypothetical protein MMA231_01638 [Asticcacaulis sp. MM231]|uniref:hypothetical protein n=1 Tax=Asticcacaulis sp. MM231 TaxID=3157666 RepID=UPI0032D56D6D
MTASDLFNSYWWLIFPIFGMGMGLIGMLGTFRHRSETLKLIKYYADQGKDPPPALLDALRSNEPHGFDYSARHGRRRGGAWTQVVVFGALSAAFGYFGYYGGGGQVFIALALGFGVAAVSLLVISIIRAAASRPADLDPKD